MKFISTLLFTCLTLISAGVNDPQPNPPQQWTEHWFEHNRNLQLTTSNDQIALYLDDIPNDSSTAWILELTTAAWIYTKAHYQTALPQNSRLHVILHADRYGGGHPSTYFDGHHDYRNVIDIGLGKNEWITKSHQATDIILHEISHIVEIAGFKVHGSPQFRLWGDSKWAEIYIYDYYLKNNLLTDAQRVRNDFSPKKENFPRANSAWFSNWFYPIYSQYGETTVIERYFTILSQNYPKSGSNPDYSRDMNMGEFVAFWSAAARKDLRSQAQLAFGTDYATEYNTALQTFPALKNIINPPATQAPTKPPATQTPATKPPATQPPATQPPATQAPVTQPPPPINNLNGQDIAASSLPTSVGTSGSITVGLIFSCTQDSYVFVDLLQTGTWRKYGFSATKIIGSGRGSLNAKVNIGRAEDGSAITPGTNYVLNLWIVTVASHDINPNTAWQRSKLKSYPTTVVAGVTTASVTFDIDENVQHSDVPDVRCRPIGNNQSVCTDAPSTGNTSSGAITSINIMVLMLAIIAAFIAL